MNKYKLAILFFLIVIVSLAYNQIKNKKTNFQTNPNTEILGLWHMENSPSDKIEFLNTGIVNYYEDNIILYSFTYELTPTCEGHTLNSGNVGMGLYLKETDQEDGSISCSQILGLNYNNNVFSLMDDNGRIIVYVR